MTNLSQPMLKSMIALAVACAFGYLFLSVSPLFAVRPVYLFAIPLICVLTVLFLRNPIYLVAVILFSRALLDAVLANSRFNIFGFSTG